MGWLLSTPAPHVYTYSVHTHTNAHFRSEHTHKVVLETQIHTQTAFLQTQSSFFGLISAAPLPPGRMTRLFIFPMPTLNSNISPPSEKACVCLAKRTKKVGKYQQTIYIRTKTNKPRRKKLLKRSKPFFAPEILLMWLQAACQPNLIWIYIQRKCLV